MITYAIYDLDTGRILSRGTCYPAGVAEQLRFFDNAEFYLNCPDGATHIIDGAPVTMIELPTEQQIIDALTAVVQRSLDSAARAHHYDGILSLCSYSTSTDPVFAAEGQAGVIWRDACWRRCYEIMAEVRAATRPVPTGPELLAELPEIVWPEPAPE